MPELPCSSGFRSDSNQMIKNLQTYKLEGDRRDNHTKRKEELNIKETQEVLVVWADFSGLENFILEKKKANPQDKFIEHQTVQALFIYRSS